eukprot:scaffold99257_cov18-Tisochrysis_lutea.AAC.1
MGVDGRLGVRGCKMVSKAGHAKDRDVQAYRADQCSKVQACHADKCRRAVHASAGLPCKQVQF